MGGQRSVLVAPVPRVEWCLDSLEFFDRTLLFTKKKSGGEDAERCVRLPVEGDLKDFRSDKGEPLDTAGDDMLLMALDQPCINCHLEQSTLSSSTLTKFRGGATSFSSTMEKKKATTHVYL